MDGIRAIKANNVINKNLTFKFDGHPINTARITFIILLLMVIMSEMFSSYSPFIIILIIIVIVMAIINKLSIYSISFDNENIIIVNKFKKYIINYKYGIEVEINKKLNSATRTYLRFFNERRYRYSLVIKKGHEYFALASVVGDSLVDDITKFIENFSFDKNTKNDEVSIKKHIYDLIISSSINNFHIEINVIENCKSFINY